MRRGPDGLRPCTCYSSPRAHVHRPAVHARADRSRAAAGDRCAALRRQRRPAVARRLRELPGVARRDRGRPSERSCSRATSSPTMLSAVASSARSRRARAPGSRCGWCTPWLGLPRFVRHLGRAGGRRAPRCARSTRSASQPFGWVSRDHRKTMPSTRRRFVSGLCVARRWEGERVQRLEPWRDTGVEIAGRPSPRSSVPRAGLDVCGARSPKACGRRRRDRRGRGSALRVVVGVPSAGNLSASTRRSASLARQVLVARPIVSSSGAHGTRQALRAAARDGRRRAPAGAGRERYPGAATAVAGGYRPLLEAGVRVRVERDDAARQDRGRRRRVGARRLDQPQARRASSATGNSTSRSRMPLRRHDGRHVRGRPARRDGNRADATEPVRTPTAARERRLAPAPCREARGAPRRAPVRRQRGRRGDDRSPASRRRGAGAAVAAGGNHGGRRGCWDCCLLPWSRIRWPSCSAGSPSPSSSRAGTVRRARTCGEGRRQRTSRPCWSPG